jgi:hypothetical protein
MPGRSNPSLRELTFDIPFFEGVGAGPLGFALLLRKAPETANPNHFA